MKRDRRPVRAILVDARRALGMSQREFGSAVGSSHRSAARWDTGKATPADHHLRTLAALLHPADRALAAEVADAVDETLESLGLETPPPAPPSTQPRTEDLVELLVLVAVEETGAAPPAARKWLHAVFKRGTELGLTMDASEKALRARAKA